MKTIYEKYAELLVGYSLGLKKGDQLLISTTYLAEPLVREVVRQVLKVGAHPETWIAMNGISRVRFEEADSDQLAHVSPLFSYAVEHYQAFLTIRAPFNVKELQSVDPEKIKTASMAKAGIRQLFRDRAAAGDLNWSLCEFPTDAQAQECGLSRSEYEDFVLSACFLDDPDPQGRWTEVHESQQRIVDLLNKRRQIRFVGTDIDISFSTEGRLWVNSDGRRNMPSGEVYTSPVENSVEGHIRFSYPGIYMGQEIEDIRLTVREGRVVEWHAEKGKNLLDRVLEIPGANRFGEAAVGTNYGIKRFSRNMLFDEKIGGTIHMALGSSYGEARGENQSAVHWDLLADMTRDGEIYADGDAIYRNGRFLI
jgi:aminopeptidase